MPLKEISILRFRQAGKLKFKTDTQTTEGTLKKEKTLVKWDEAMGAPDTGLEEKDDKVCRLAVLNLRINTSTNSKSSRTDLA
jgi:Zn-dependent M32 family carboxypeptidase